MKIFCFLISIFSIKSIYASKYSTSYAIRFCVIDIRKASREEAKYKFTYTPGPDRYDAQTYSSGIADVTDLNPNDQYPQEINYIIKNPQLNQEYCSTDYLFVGVTQFISIFSYTMQVSDSNNPFVTSEYGISIRSNHMKPTYSDRCPSKDGTFTFDLEANSELRPHLKLDILNQEGITLLSNGWCAAETYKDTIGTIPTIKITYTNDYEPVM